MSLSLPNLTGTPASLRAKLKFEIAVGASALEMKPVTLSNWIGCVLTMKRGQPLSIVAIVRYQLLDRLDR
jgi:hypothetical protein